MKYIIFLIPMIVFADPFGPTGMEPEKATLFSGAGAEQRCKKIYGDCFDLNGKNPLFHKHTEGGYVLDANMKSEYDSRITSRDNAVVAKAAKRIARRNSLKNIDWQNITNAQLKAIVRKLVEDKEL